MRAPRWSGAHAASPTLRARHHPVGPSPIPCCARSPRTPPPKKKKGMLGVESSQHLSPLPATFPSSGARRSPLNEDPADPPPARKSALGCAWVQGRAGGGGKVTVSGPSVGMSQAPRVTVGRANSSSLLRLSPCARRGLGVLGVRPGLAWWGGAGRTGWDVPDGESIPTPAADDFVDRFPSGLPLPIQGPEPKIGWTFGDPDFSISRRMRREPRVFFNLSKCILPPPPGILESPAGLSPPVPHQSSLVPPVRTP